MRYCVDIETVFDQTKYPQREETREIAFSVETLINEHFFHRFLTRFNVMEDQFAILSFKSSSEENEEENKEGEARFRYRLTLKSEKMMKCTVEQFAFAGELADTSAVRDRYKVILKREVF